MRKLIPVLCFIILSSCKMMSQCLIDSLYRENISTYNDEYRDLIKMLDQDEEGMNGAKPALIVESIDTLNKNEIVYTQFVPGSKGNKDVKEVLMSFCQVSEDTTIIYIGFVLFEEDLVNSIFKNEVQTTLRISYKYDKLLKLEEHQEPTNELIVPVKNEVFKMCEVDGFIYGYSICKTEPYFILDKFNSSQYLKIQKKYEYYFKCKHP